MHFSRYLTTAQIRLLDSVSSKKKTLETLSELLTSQNGALKARQVFTALFEREQMGSTAVGHGAAIPHCRIAGLERPLAALLRVGAGIDYDAADGLPVRLFFALLVPENADQQHLELLAGLATQLNEPVFVRRLLEAGSADEILGLLRQGAQAQ
ncbi:MAG: PTS sugar transporter subunit IIA [Gammaproteobacteria bacterium]|nr:PTS sugar transporter subunit IIA [Gammaproteobacteria bacterium]MDD9807393.1 PTS sugar transporter subunit IIA [Gammaproteobacteria bacterium]MDD9869148.1 PTS sugar transporter subunit IIA [Gammaproteobacteria bacterium]MDD9886171.1 PTS sugar transporter subunit IIA [Gammaproteobacteria bacterium]